MSDADVAKALRSAAPLVVVEAPGGCGKTFQGADYAREIAACRETRILILTHTNAACDVFAGRTRGCLGAVDIRTLDSLVVEVASAYHVALGLPEDVAVWASTTIEGYGQLRAKVATLLRRFPPVAASLASRYGRVICDEHQDADAAQHETVMAMLQAGAHVRIFGDPAQRIYGGNQPRAVTAADAKRWNDLVQTADRTEKLEEPHRWTRAGAGELGAWILQARTILRSGGTLDLRRRRPLGLRILFAENLAMDRRGLYFDANDARPIRDLIQNAPELLILTTQNKMVQEIRRFMNRSIPIWEGHIRRNLTKLAMSCRVRAGDPVGIAKSLLEFTNSGAISAEDVTVVTGFSESAFGRRLVAEVESRCARNCHGMPARLQDLARLIIGQPDHRGVAACLERLVRLKDEDPSFEKVHIDHWREYRDAIRLGEFEDPVVGIAELSQRRSAARLALPRKAVSTIHKAKGLEVKNVLVLPCDGQQFGNTDNARCKLYVALSRATSSLTLVLSRKKPSPLVLG